MLSLIYASLLSFAMSGQTPCECPSGWRVGMPIVETRDFNSDDCDIYNLDCRISVLLECCVVVSETRIVLETENGISRLPCHNISWDERLRQQSGQIDFQICKTFALGPCAGVRCWVPMREVRITQTAECESRRRTRQLIHIFPVSFNFVCMPYGLGNCPCDDQPVVVPLPEATPIYPIIRVI